jgi:predicted ATPase/class 3 adenylate cyclase/ribosomal protein L40E
MKCPKCQFENPVGIQFCGKCGTKLAKICSQCGFDNPPGFDFCGKCGQILAEPQSPPPVDYSQPLSYTPKHLADKILSARPSMEGERKQVTVLFADVKGFTSISEKLDPEKVRNLISECLVYFTEEVHRYEGAIAQFLGDGVMALFGAPIAHEDAPQRALYAALAIRDRLRRYAEKLKKDGIDFKMRIGLNTGLVVVGRIGDDLTMEYTAMGDTVNLASRMESAAEPGTIQVAENTYRLSKDYFDFKALGEIDVKGKKEPVKAYQLTGIGRARTRLGVSVARGLTPFVGRQRELDQLMHCYSQVREGQGQVVGIVGEPGVGKSRLLLEFIRFLPREEYTYLEGECLQYGSSIPYLPFLEILRAYFGFTEGEQEFLIKSKLEQGIAHLDEKLRGFLPPLQDILSLKVENREYLKLEPQQRREQAFDALRAILVRESQNRPLILAIDGLQWIDKTSEEFLTYLIGGLASTHVLLVLLYRPEYTHPWGSKTYYSQVRTDQLPPNMSNDLVRAILGGEDVAPALRTLILDRATGNPLFMEELTHSLLENGSIKKKDHQYVLSKKPSEIQVPETIQGIIAARIDRLQEDLKHTMQVASVIGKDFAYRILQTITGMQQELKSWLLNLQELEFIYEKSLFPELEYMFKHALTQEVAYNSLLLQRRKEIHESIGKAIEELYPDRLAEFYEVLAYHYSAAESWEKAYQYLKLSGDKTLRTHSRWEPFRFYKEALQALRKLPESEENKRRDIDIRLSLISPMSYLYFPEDSLEILQEGERLSRELGDERSLARFHAGLGIYYATRGDRSRAREYLEDAFQAAKKVQDPDLMAPIGFQICGTYFAQGDYLKLAEVAPGVIALLESTQRESQFFGASSRPYSNLVSLYGLALGATGNFPEGQAQCEKALRFSTRLNDQPGIAWAESWYSMLFVSQGDGKRVIEHAEQAIKYAEPLQNLVVLSMAWHLLGTGHYFLGDYENALKYMEKSREITRDLRLPDASISLASLCQVYIALGDLANAQSCAEKALELAQKEQDKRSEGLSSMNLGRILVMQDRSRLAEAEQLILRGMEIANELKMRPFYAHGYLYLGEVYALTGQKERALENLKKAEAMYQEMGMDYWFGMAQSSLQSIQG